MANVVYDLAKKEAELSEDLQGLRYGTLMTGHFGISEDVDADSTEKLHRLRALAGRSWRTPEEQRELDEVGNTLAARSAAMALEVFIATGGVRGAPGAVK